MEKISQTMAQIFETLRDKAHKIIYHGIQERRENNLISILIQKKLKAVCLMFKCLHGTSIRPVDTGGQGEQCPPIICQCFGDVINAA